MSAFSDIVRERAVVCCWCLDRKTWALDGVCKSKDCRARADRYKVRRSSVTAADERGSTATRPAPGPRDDAAPTHLGVTASPGAAFSAGEEVGALPVEVASSWPSSPAGSEVRHG